MLRSSTWHLLAPRSSSASLYSGARRCTRAVSFHARTREVSPVSNWETPANEKTDISICFESSDVRAAVKTILQIHTNIPSGFDDKVAARLCHEVLENYPKNPAVILPAARCCIRAYKQGLVSDITPLRDMLCTLVPHSKSLPNIYVARAIRAASALDYCEVTKCLVSEASREHRLASYSAMDLSELIQSVHAIRIKCMEPGEVLVLTQFLRDLMTEVSSRRHTLNVANEVARSSHKRATNLQHLSFIAVSNILFCLRDFTSSDCRSVLRDLLGSREFTEDDAVAGAPLWHLVSVCESLLLTSTSSDEETDWKVFKRIVKELIRKVNSNNEQNPYLESCIKSLIIRYGKKKPLLEFISQ